jgi:hypothetical protein
MGWNIPESLETLGAAQTRDLDSFLIGIMGDYKSVLDSKKQSNELVSALQDRVKILEADLATHKFKSPPRLPTPNVHDGFEPNMKEMQRLLSRVEVLCNDNELLQSLIQHLRSGKTTDVAPDIEVKRLKQAIDKLSNDNELLRLELLSRPPLHNGKLA